MIRIPVRTDQPGVPDSITKAVYLMMAGAALEVVQGLIGALGELSQPSVLLLGLVICALMAGIWVWVARACQEGRSGARVLGSIFFGLATVGVVQALMGKFSANGAIVTVDVLSWLVGLGATVLLWQPESSEYLHRGRR